MLMLPELWRLRVFVPIVSVLTMQKPPLVAQDCGDIKQAAPRGILGG